MRTSRVEAILTKISERGGRITKPRERIITYLLSASQPKSIQEIVKQMKGDTVSVYRTIALLKEMGLVEELTAPSGVNRYALHEEHHDHLVCTKCGYTAHIPCTERDETIPKHAQFKKLSAHQVTYFGICVQCAT